MFRLDIDDGIGWLRLGRPQVRNAIQFGEWRNLAAMVARAEASPARVLIVAGEPAGPFCAGADLGDFQGFRGDAAAAATFRTAMRAGLDALRTASLPTIASIEGACYGAGVALAMACDLRVAGDGAAFAITPAKLGISYPQEDVHRLVALVGPGQAARLLLGAGPIDADEAHRIGLVEMRGDAALAGKVARAIGANDAESLRTLKRALALAQAGTASEDRQDDDFDALIASDRVSERLASLRGRR